MGRLVLVLILSINLTLAQQIKPINKGDTAPFDGFVIDKQFEKDRRTERELLDVERQQTALLKELGKIQVGRADFYKEEAKRAKKEALKSEFKAILYFLGGVVIGGASVYVGSKLK